MNAHRNLLLTLIVLQTATLGFSLYTFLSPPQRSADTAFVIAGQPGPGQPTISMAELKAELRAIVRSEIAAHDSAAGQSLADSVAADKTVALSDDELKQQEQAVAASDAIVRQAVAAGVWTRADSQALLEHIDKVSPEQLLELADELATAVNRQQMKLEDIPPL